jgi:hypothetical protein
LQIALGEEDAADVMLDDAEAFTQMVPRMGRLGFATLDAEIAAVRGDEERAMNLLKESVDSGWVTNWWWALRHNPNLSSLHQRDDYQRLVEDVESKINRQRAELERAAAGGPSRWGHLYYGESPEFLVGCSTVLGIQAAQSADAL